MSKRDLQFPGMPHGVHRALSLILRYAGSLDAARALLGGYDQMLQTGKAAALSIVITTSIAPDGEIIEDLPRAEDSSAIKTGWEFPKYALPGEIFLPNGTAERWRYEGNGHWVNLSAFTEKGQPTRAVSRTNLEAGEIAEIRVSQVG